MQAFLPLRGLLQILMTGLLRKPFLLPCGSVPDAVARVVSAAVRPPDPVAVSAAWGAPGAEDAVATLAIPAVVAWLGAAGMTF